MVADLTRGSLWLEPHGRKPIRALPEVLVFEAVQGGRLASASAVRLQSATVGRTTVR